MLGRGHGLAAMHAANVAYLHAGETVPPAGQLPQVGEQHLTDRFISCGSGFAHQSRIEIEDLFEDLDQFINARIANAVLAGREEREETLKAKDVPGVGQRTAGDAAPHQLLSLWKRLHGLLQIPFVREQLPRRDPAHNLA